VKPKLTDATANAGSWNTESIKRDTFEGSYEARVMFRQLLGVGPPRKPLARLFEWVNLGNHGAGGRTQSHGAADSIVEGIRKESQGACRTCVASWCFGKYGRRVGGPRESGIGIDEWISRGVQISEALHSLAPWPSTHPPNFLATVIGERRRKPHPGVRRTVHTYRHS
jgi:hypothetical protein